MVNGKKVVLILIIKTVIAFKTFFNRQKNRLMIVLGVDMEKR